MSVSDRHLARVADDRDWPAGGTWPQISWPLLVPLGLRVGWTTSRPSDGRKQSGAVKPKEAARGRAGRPQPPQKRQTGGADDGVGLLQQDGAASSFAAGVGRVEEDGWEKAAAASIWSALVSEGFYLMKSANRILLSKPDRSDSGDGGSLRRAAARVEATAALLLAIARFEAVRRLFGGRCYNSDLARNTGAQRSWRVQRRRSECLDGLATPVRGQALGPSPRAPAAPPSPPARCVRACKGFSCSHPLHPARSFLHTRVATTVSQSCFGTPPASSHFIRCAIKGAILLCEP